MRHTINILFKMWKGLNTKKREHHSFDCKLWSSIEVIISTIQRKSKKMIHEISRKQATCCHHDAPQGATPCHVALLS